MVPRLQGAQLPLGGSTPRDVAAIKQAIADDLAGYEAMQVIADLMVVGFARDSSTDFEPAATMEYVASVLLERSSPAPTVSGRAFQEKDSAVERTLERVRGLTLFGIGEGMRAADEASTAIEALAEYAKALDAVNRWPGYEPQIADLLRHCLSERHIEDHLQSRLGFGIEQALACDAAVRVMLAQRLNAWRDHVAEAVRQGLELYDSGARPTPPGLEATSAEQREHRYWWLVSKYFHSDGLVEAMSFEVGELAETAQVEEPAAESFVERFTTEWGASKGMTLLRGRNQVRLRPLLRGVDGRVHPTSPGNLLWALRPAFEEALKSAPPIFDRYQARRATYAEQQTAGFLQEALAPDALLTNVEFKLADTNGEADVLLRVDDLVIVVEVKSGAFPDAALSGRKGVLQRTLEGLLGKSARQIDRLESALQKQEQIEFVDRESGGPMAFDLDGVRRTRSIVVTLEDLSGLVAQPRLLRDAGIVPPEFTMPWCVSLFTLETIVCSCEFPAQLTGYLEERGQIDERAMWADEDDLWMTHLLSQLSFSRVEASRFMVDGRTDLLQEQWLHDRRPPRMKLPKATRKAVRRLARERRSGWLTECETLFTQARNGRRPRIAVPLQ